MISPKSKNFQERVVHLLDAEWERIGKESATPEEAKEAVSRVMAQVRRELLVSRDMDSEDEQPEEATRPKKGWLW